MTQGRMPPGPPGWALASRRRSGGIDLLLVSPARQSGGRRRPGLGHWHRAPAPSGTVGATGDQARGDSSPLGDWGMVSLRCDLIMGGGDWEYLRFCAAMQRAPDEEGLGRITAATAGELLSVSSNVQWHRDCLCWRESELNEGAERNPAGAIGRPYTGRDCFIQGPRLHTHHCCAQICRSHCHSHMQHRGCLATFRAELHGRLHLP